MRFFKKIISNLLRKIGFIILNEKKFLYLTRSHPYSRTLELINKHLPSKKRTIFEIGGGIGDRIGFISKFLKDKNMYYIFEPNTILFKNLKLKFKDKKIFKIYNFGFLNTNKKQKLYVTKDPLLASNYKSKFTKKYVVQNAEFKKMKSFILKNKIKKIDCLLLNTQGSEIEILKSMHEQILNTKLVVIEVDLIQRYNIRSQSMLFEIQRFFSKMGFSLIDITLIKNENSKKRIKTLELAFLRI